MESYHPLSHQLDTLLNDSEGVRQFHKFLSSSFSSGHLLDFWFACKGFRSIVDGDDQLKLLQVSKAIYRTYIKTDAALSVPVNDSTKREIRSTLTAFSHSYHNSITGEKRFPVLRKLFDAAQSDIQSLLARSYFFEFLQSDFFRMIHQSPSELECNVSYSDKFSHHVCYDQSDKHRRGYLFPNGNLQQCIAQSGSGEGVSLATTDAPDQNHVSCTSQAKALACGTVSPDRSRGAAVESGGARDMVTASELIAYMNPAEDCSNTAASGGIDYGLPAAHPSRPSQAPIAVSAIEATARKPGTNLAEVDPSAFAQTLSYRLEKVKESRGKMERLLSRMQPIDLEETGGEDAELISINAGANKPFSSPHPTRSTRLSSSSCRATSATSGDLLRKKLSALLPSSTSSVPVPPADDAQVILEDHCSRIWTDERRGQPLNVCRKGGRRSDVYSISSFDSGVGTCGGGGLNSSDSESCISRGGVFHQHHHHHHQQQHYRWNHAPPPSSTSCSFCRRAPSMNSNPEAYRKEAVSVSSSSGNYRWGVQYQRTQQYHHGHIHHYNLEESDFCGSGRAIRSRSLTSDSPSVFDSGLSSTYDHLPPPRRSRLGEHKIVQQGVNGTTSMLGGRMTPLQGDKLNRPLSDCDAERHATPAVISNNADLLNPSYRLPPPLTRPDRQKLAQQSNSVAVTATRLTGSDLLKPAPGCASLPPPSHQQQQLFSPPASFNLVVGYYLCDDPVPYRTIWTGPLTSVDTATPNALPSITLGQFKQLVAKKGVYRYFFKTPSDDFGTGCVHEEVGDDNAVLPLWEGKVIARVERAD